MTHQKGFTLVELLVAVGIIGVLASVSLVSINSVRAKGRDAKRISEVREMQKALETFYSNNSSYPLGTDKGAKIELGSGEGVTMCNTSNGAPNDVFGGYGFAADDAPTAVAGDGNCSNPIFMKKINKDPGSAKYEYTAGTCAGEPGALTPPCAGYTVDFQLEGGTGNFRGGVPLHATPNGISE